jgi:5-methylcytosine-specific restriction endonuclease McrA
MARRKLTPAQKAEIVEQQGGVCFACSEPLDDDPALGPTEYDHVIALALGGADEPDNICAMHQRCHRGHDGKTSQDIRMIRKADRQRRKHEEGRGRKRKGKPIKSAGFPKGLRKKLNGKVEYVNDDT